LDSFSENVIASKTDKSGKITYISKAFEEISGFKADELLKKSHNLVRHPDMPNEVFDDMWKTINKGEIWKGEVKNKTKNGDSYWVAAVIKPTYNKDNKIDGFSSIRENITNRKKVEELNNELESYKSHLEDKVKEATKEITTLNKEIEDTQKEVVFTMGAIGESRSKETGNHVKRVAEYSKLFALKYGMSEDEAELLKQASPMHDIGKVAIPDSILNKPGRLTENEFVAMQSHCEIGYEMLKKSNRPLLQTAAIVCSEHHEKWDGSGYPKGKRGEDIHILGRITAIADVFDALGTDRCYKKAWDDEKIFNLFKEERGKHFDPKLVDIFFENKDSFLAIRNEFKEDN
jgi:PAS domain S-box-containing protein